MGLFRRRPPAAMRARLVQDERVVAWAAGSSGDPIVVTTRGLWLPGRAERLGWHQINKAAWAEGQLRVTEAVVVSQRDGYAITEDAPLPAVILGEPGDVPAQVRQRVNNSVARTAHHALSGGGVRIVGRRVSGTSGLSWQARFDPGTDWAQESILAAVDDLVAQATAEVAAAASL